MVLGLLWDWVVPVGLVTASGPLHRSERINAEGRLAGFCIAAELTPSSGLLLPLLKSTTRHSGLSSACAALRGHYVPSEGLPSALRAFHASV